MRYHYMDAMRGILMMFGVVLHTAQIYNPAQIWKLHADQSLSIAGWLADFIMLFRMPAFFVISGFFCALTLSRYSPDKFLRIRLSRILLPMLVTALTANLVMNNLLGLHGWLDFSYQAYFLEGQWISHLWFLINLVFYFLLAAVLAALIPARLSQLNQLIASLTHIAPMLLLLLVIPLSAVFVKSLNLVGFPLYETFLFNSVKPYSLLRYLPHFSFGILLFSVPALLDRFINANTRTTFLLVVLAAIGISLSTRLPSALQQLGHTYFYALTGWLGVVLIFKLFHRYFNKPSAPVLFLSDASYTVYLFHQLLVVALGLLAINMGIASLPAMFLVMGISISLSLLLHAYFIRCNSWLSFLFNGKPAPAVAVAQPLAV